MPSRSRFLMQKATYCSDCAFCCAHQLLHFWTAADLWHLDGCRGAVSCSVGPHSFFLSSFSSSSSSAAQPHSHSSSLSSVELFSASDDVHRFSAQVLYCSRQQAPVSPEARTQPLQKGGGGAADSMRMSTNQSVQHFKRVSCPSFAACRLFITVLIAVFGTETLLNVNEISGMTQRLLLWHASFHCAD